MTHALHKLKHLLGEKWQMCCINQEKQYFKRCVAKSFEVANALLQHLLRKKSNVLQKQEIGEMIWKLLQCICRSNQRKGSQSYYNAFASLTERKWSQRYCDMFATLTERKGSQSYCNTFATLTERKGSQSYCDAFATLTKKKGAKVIATCLPL